eukprot:3112299-Rhodomonas_salina.4
MSEIRARAFNVVRTAGRQLPRVCSNGEPDLRMAPIPRRRREGSAEGSTQPSQGIRTRPQIAIPGPDAAHLGNQGLIVREFDPKKADSVFSAAGSPPKWLELMVDVPPFLSSSFPSPARENPDASANARMCMPGSGSNLMAYAMERISQVGLEVSPTSVRVAPGSDAAVSCVHRHPSRLSLFFPDTDATLCTFSYLGLTRLDTERYLVLTPGFVWNPGRKGWGRDSRVEPADL